MQYESVPSSETEDYKDTGGAFISCWVKAPSVEAAKVIALDAIKDNGWVVVQCEDSYPISEESYKKDDESLVYFRQASLNGDCYVYDKWPNEPQEEDIVQ